MVDVACGERHVLLVTEKGDIFSFGCGSSGALGTSCLLSAEPLNLSTYSPCSIGQGTFTADQPSEPKQILALQKVCTNRLSGSESI